MRFAVGDLFVYETMETFKITQVDTAREVYKIDVFDDEGIKDRKIELTKTQLEDNPVWQQIN